MQRQREFLQIKVDMFNFLWGGSKCHAQNKIRRLPEIRFVIGSVRSLLPGYSPDHKETLLVDFTHR